MLLQHHILCVGGFRLSGFWKTAVQSLTTAPLATAPAAEKSKGDLGASGFGDCWETTAGVLRRLVKGGPSFPHLPFLLRRLFQPHVKTGRKGTW